MTGPIKRGSGQFARAMWTRAVAQGGKHAVHLHQLDDAPPTTRRALRNTVHACDRILLTKEENHSPQPAKSKIKTTSRTKEATQTKRTAQQRRHTLNILGIEQYKKENIEEKSESLSALKEFGEKTNERIKDILEKENLDPNARSFLGFVVKSLGGNLLVKSVWQGHMNNLRMHMKNYKDSPTGLAFKEKNPESFEKVAVLTKLIADGIEGITDPAIYKDVRKAFEVYAHNRKQGNWAAEDKLTEKNSIATATAIHKIVDTLKYGVGSTEEYTVEEMDQAVSHFFKAADEKADPENAIPFAEAGSIPPWARIAFLTGVLTLYADYKATQLTKLKNRIEKLHDNLDELQKNNVELENFYKIVVTKLAEAFEVSISISGLDKSQIAIRRENQIQDHNKIMNIHEKIIELSKKIDKYNEEKTNLEKQATESVIPNDIQGVVKEIISGEIRSVLILKDKAKELGAHIKSGNDELLELSSELYAILKENVSPKELHEVEEKFKTLLPSETQNEDILGI